MADFLRDKLGLSVKDKGDADRITKNVKSVVTFLTDAIDAIKKVPGLENIKEATPWWVPEVAGAAADVLPPFKFALGVIERLTNEHDPLALGLFACTTAYQKSVEIAISWAGVPEIAKKVSLTLKEEIANLEPTEDFDFSGFSFHRALEHPFIKNADVVFKRYIDGVGYSETQKRLLISKTHRIFVSQLKSLLSHGKLKKRFEPFTELMKLDTTEKRAYDTILSHIEYQRWQFEEAPVFGKEPYALSHVYIDIECGVLRWDEIDLNAKERKARVSVTPNKTEKSELPFDPFSEQCGGRHNLLGKVIELMGDPNFKSDAIIIQGAAGSGKSSFTLKLASHLEKLGLFPVRIRLRDLPLDVHLDEAILKALFPPDHELPPSMRGRSIEDPFSAGVLNDSVSFGSATIRPYVLILDGWDEISLSADEGFKIRVSKMLEQVRSTYLRASGPHIRVILTGRPSADVGSSNFLKASTPILTVRPIRPDELRLFVDRVRLALECRPVEMTDKTDMALDAWEMPSNEELEAVFSKYKADFVERQGSKDGNLDMAASDSNASMAVLGLPLLAHLAFRLIARWDGDRAELIADPTTLYRNLVDLTCVKRGQPEESCVELSNKHPKGADLRLLLQRVAAAMTAQGEESISYRELELRLNDDRLNEHVTQLLKDHDLATLMIAFFFKGGHDALGCEFLHKSFREYLFAECIIQTLKDFSGKDSRRIPRKREYWKDFDKEEDLFSFSRALGDLLSPQWLSLEVVAHLERLLPWEISRAIETKAIRSDSAHSTILPPLKLDQWKNIRDALADLWQWWGEGIHLRPQVERSRRGGFELRSAYVHELVELDLPRDDSNRQRVLQPARSVTMDSHLGDALFRLNAIVHYQVALLEGWLEPRIGRDAPNPAELWRGVDEAVFRLQPYQASIHQENKNFLMFAPSGNDGHYLGYYAARINAAGWRRGGVFPSGINISGCDLRNVSLHNRSGTFSIPSIWTHSNLVSADFEGCNLSGHNLSHVYADDIRLSQCLLVSTSFVGAHLERAQFYYSWMPKVNLMNANLTMATIQASNMKDAITDGSILDNVDWGKSDGRGIKPKIIRQSKEQKR